MLHIKKYQRFLASLCLMLLATTLCFAQEVTFNYRGYWSKWERAIGEVSAYQDGSGLILSVNGNTYFKFMISNYTPPTRAEIDRHREQNQWFEYYGTVDYYVNDSYPTAEDLAKSCCFVIPNAREDLTPSVMRHASARIRVEPYKNNPKNYNIFFDNIGVAVGVKGLEFKGQKSRKNRGRVAANIIQSILLFPVGCFSWLWNPVYDHKGD